MGPPQPLPLLYCCVRLEEQTGAEIKSPRPEAARAQGHAAASRGASFCAMVLSSILATVRWLSRRVASFAASTCLHCRGAAHREANSEVAG